MRQRRLRLVAGLVTIVVVASAIAFGFWRSATSPTGVVADPATSSAAGEATTGTSSAVSTVAGAPPGKVSTSDTLNLPRIPWEGGPQYWSKFPKTARAGWTDPHFFPIVSWFNGISSDAEVKYDKSLGFNSYIGMSAETQYQLFGDNGVFWIGDALNSSFGPDSKNWAGNFLDDEVDGRFPVAEGEAHLRQLKDARNNGRFNYANFTQMVASKDMKARDAQAFVNNYTDAVSLDMYFYTIPFCDWNPYRENYMTPIAKANCRTASSYGAMIDSLRARDGADGKRQAIWQFVEILNGGPGEGPFLANITPDQLRGAVMSSVIHEARGIVYFNQSLSGPCQGGNLIRLSQVQKGFCGAAQIAAAGKVNNQILKLAPAINTQSYAYNFGSGLDTMLKVYKGNAYIFAMTAKGGTGARQFKLPPGVLGNQVEVLSENRKLPVSGGGFTDSFASENSYHIYKISLSAASGD